MTPPATPPSPAPSVTWFALLRPVIWLSALVAVLWLFPGVWYTGGASSTSFKWFTENTSIPGWKWNPVPVGESAEKVLVADRMVNGEFTNSSGTRIRAYSAKRYLKKENEIGLFSHTPDRCWTGAGWKLEPTEPDFVEFTVHGVTLLLERRIFRGGLEHELVYFGALVGGKPLPYRLDQYQSAGLKQHEKASADRTGTLSRLLERRLWGWAWQSFSNRTPLAGPQQFIRVSTPIAGRDLKIADASLHDFIMEWLKPVEYEKELAAWKANPEKQPVVKQPPH